MQKPRCNWPALSPSLSHSLTPIPAAVSLSVRTSYVWQRNKNQKHNFLYQFKALSSNKNVRPACLLLLRVFSLLLQLLLIHFALLFICAQLLHTHTRSYTHVIAACKCGLRVLMAYRGLRCHKAQHK